VAIAALDTTAGPITGERRQRMTDEEIECEIDQTSARDPKGSSLQIDPETAEIMWKHANIVDPYGVYPDCPAECIGRVYFARPSGSDVWVCFDDLPHATVKALREKQELRRAFPEPTVYRRAKELLIVSEDQEQIVCVRVEQASKLIEKMRAALKEHETNGS
jgi:hypothetical protein